MVSTANQGVALGGPAFDRCGGHPALDFVNSLDNRFNSTQGRLEGLRSYADLLRFARETGLLEPMQAAQIGRTLAPEVAARALRGGKALREALAQVLYAVVDQRPSSAGSLETLERYFHLADRQRELRWLPDAGGRTGLAWCWRSSQGAAELPVWVIAHAAHELVLSPDLARVRACEADTCRWLFLDTSRNHTRRWCKMQVCGNRMKARRYQVRHSG